MKDAAISRGKQAKSLGVDIKLSTTVTKDLLEVVAPDEVIVATGGKPTPINIPGSDLAHVYNSFDVLRGDVKAKGKIAVIGGGLVGLEVAAFLAEDKDNQVIVLEMQAEVGQELGIFRKICVMENLYVSGIETKVNTTVKEIKAGSIVIETDGEISEINCDAVVTAVGAVSRNYEEIQAYCESNEIPYNVIGDAKKARRAIDAIAEAASLARTI